MKLGIVGLPNVGKSTLFNAITSTKNAEAANYPFCTIEPNSGIVAVPDKRLDKLAEIWQTNKKTPAIVEFVDIAGLVKGASQGAGLGNKFLGHIRECDAIVHVVRCFDDDNIIHVVEDVSKAEAVDPIADIDAIDYELILSDLEVVQNRAGRMAKAAKSGNNKGAAAEAAWLQQLADHLSAGKPARSFDFDEGDDAQKAVRKELGLLSAKPEESAQAVHRLQEEAHMWKDKLVRSQTRAMEQLLDNLPDDVENYFVFEEDVDKNVARRFADEGKGKCHGICGIFLGNDTDGYRYILGSESIDLKVFSKTFHEALGGKGGGKPEMIQGTVTASEEMIRSYMESV